MRKELQTIELIEQYLMGKLTPAEKVDFETQMKSDKGLKEKVELQEQLVAGLERIGLKVDLKRVRRKIWLRKLIIYFLIGLVATALIAGIAWQWNEASPLPIEKNIITEPTIEVEVTPEVKNETSALITPVLKDHYDSTDKLVEPSTSSVFEQDEKVSFPIKKTQWFVIDPTRDTTLFEEEGSIIQINAHSFETDSQEKIQFSMKEYYQISDIVFSNLSTQTVDGEMIETGGMVYIEASNSTTSHLQLKQNKRITIQFPFQEKKEGMQLFIGKQHEGDFIVWEEAEEKAVKNLPESESMDVDIVRTTISRTGIENFTIIEDMPRFPGCEELESYKAKENCSREKVSEFIRKNLKLPRSYRGTIGRKQIFISFIVNEVGSVEEVKVVRGTSDSTLIEFAKLSALSLPPFTPGRQRNRPVRVQFNVPVVFDLNSDIISGGLTDEDIISYKDSVNKLIKKRQEQVLSKIFDEKASIDERESYLNYHVFQCSQLGWINCDRYPLAKKGKSSFNIYEDNTEINCSVILHSVRAIVKPRYVRGGKYVLPQLPNEEKVSVLAFKIEDDKNYVSYYQTTHNHEKHRFVFEPLTKEKLQEITLELNSLKN